MRVQTLPPTGTRVERNTPSEVNELIRTQTDARLAGLEDGKAVEFRARLAELDREWDIERLLQANASTLVVLGTLLGAKIDRRFLLLPAAVLTFFAQHALQGWCPPLPILRRNGVRAAREIERERYAIKALRGDFDSIPAREATDAQHRVRAVIAAVDA
jgi:hypothetical protein